MDASIAHHSTRRPPCWAPNIDCPRCQGVNTQLGSAGGAGPGWVESISQPLLVAAVDPAAEAQLSGLDRCLTQGSSYLTSGPLQFHARPALGSGPSLPEVDIPALVSTTSFLDETYTISVDRSSQFAALNQGVTPDKLVDWNSISTRDLTAQSIYSTVLGQRSLVGGATALCPSRRCPVLAERRRSPSSRTTEPGLERIRGQNLSSCCLAVGAPEALDDWFRPLTQADWDNSYPSNSHMAQAAWLPVGTYDPGCIPGFSELGAGQLATYAPPQVSLPQRQEVATFAFSSGLRQYSAAAADDHCRPLSFSLTLFSTPAVLATSSSARFACVSLASRPRQRLTCP